MKTFKILFAAFSLLCISLLLPESTKADGIRGNGNVVTEDREVSSFQNIKVNGAFTIYLSQDDSYSLKIVTDENLQPIIKSQVKGDVLYITTEETIYKSTELKLYIGFKNLKSIKANGAISLKNERMLRFDELDIEIYGASSANLDLTAHCLRIDNSGASTIKLSGTADQFYVDISGAGSVNALDLQAKEAQVDISGVGSGKVNVTENLKVSISGIGSVKYKGDPKITSDISFLGSLKKY